jgi:Ca2+-binding RTX toxin-like protein
MTRCSRSAATCSLANWGELGDDWIGCSGNNNVLIGAHGNDFLGATGSNNVLDGGADNDTLAASGAHSGDRFVFHPGYGKDTIANFSRHGAGGTDVIDLNGFGLTVNTLAQYLSYQANGVAVIRFNDATVLTIANGIPPNGLLASDFVF